jgi:hypothetical protein
VGTFACLAYTCYTWINWNPNESAEMRLADPSPKRRGYTLSEFEQLQRQAADAHAAQAAAATKAA